VFTNGHIVTPDGDTITVWYHPTSLLPIFNYCYLFTFKI
jgi:hypothetical protein